jgi:hypothetical protein
MASDNGQSRTQSDVLEGRQRKQAILRLVLGQAQVFGAALAFVLLLLEGPTALVISVTVVTGLVTLVSMLLFRVIWRNRTSSS